jgi:hypothetical protein
MQLANAHQNDTPRLRPVLMTTLMLATLLAAGQASAARAPRVERDFAAQRGPIAVEVKVGGSSTPLFMASNRTDRWYLEARTGARYEIRVRNTSRRRVGFVLAVDGLNAINGRISRNTSSEPMYVLDPYESATVKGWRKDLNNVSRFVFVDEQRSYAERTGQGNGDLGWIRVTAFDEVQQLDTRTWGAIKEEYRREGGAEYEAAPRASEAPAPVRERAANGMGKDAAEGRMEAAPQSKSERHDQPLADANPGTGWGPNQRDRVRTVDFEPRHYAAGQVILRYEYKPALVALGILPWRQPQDRTWERERGLYGFAQPPRGR